jgi:RNA polymerase sigma factor (sigma-70 family)
MRQETNISDVIPPHLFKLANVEKYLECKKVVRKVLASSAWCSQTANMEDIYQEAWCILLCNWSLLQNITLYRCRYLARTAQNLCKSMMRKRQLLSNIEPEVVAGELPDVPYQNQPFLERYSVVFDELREKYGLQKIEDPLSLPSDDPTLQAFKIQLQQMESNQWKALWLKYYCDYSYKEIAAILNTSEEMVGQWLHRAKENIRTQETQNYPYGTH